jgi:NDP-sugar pyrophosphorylase family protein
MIGVIVLSGPFSGMHGLDADRSPSLLPLGDRPALQHIVESLVTQGITSIELIVGHGPERVEQLLGNGDRWGCGFRYHLAAQPDRPYRSLKIISDLATEPWVIIHAERYPCVDFAPRVPGKTHLYYGSFLKAPNDIEGASDAEARWGGTAAMSPSENIDEIANFTFDEFRSYLKERAASGAAEITTTEDWIDVSSPARLLDSQKKLLDKKLRGLLISGAERQPGIWVARNATIHPSAKLTAPIYVGTNTSISKGVKIGPYAVIGPDCIIDSNTVIDQALIFEGSYVGEGLEVHKAIVAHNLLVNVRLDASVDISENFLLGRLDQPQRNGFPGKSLQGIVAVFLILIFLPITILSWIYYVLIRRLPYTSVPMVCLPVDEQPFVLEAFALPCLGEDAWSVARLAGWEAFCRQFLPGLFAVVRGHLNLVGLPPRSIKQVEALPEDWSAIYLAGRAGLITEAAIAATDSTDEMQLYLADAYFSVQQSWSHNISLAAKYFTRLIIPKRGSR